MSLVMWPKKQRDYQCLKGGDADEGIVRSLKKKKDEGIVKMKGSQIHLLFSSYSLSLSLCIYLQLQLQF